MEHTLLGILYGIALSSGAALEPVIKLIGLQNVGQILRLGISGQVVNVSSVEY